MTRQRSVASDKRGFALVYTAVTMTGLLLFTGLAVDSGRAYMVKAQLSKAVDGAALAAARNLNSGDPEQEAIQIFRANFPAGYMGTSSVTDPTTQADFFTLETIPATGVNVITVKAEAELPTTFMKLANFNSVTVRSEGEATRRMVDLSLVLDVSGSIGSQWPAVRDAAESFVEAFDPTSDRFALVTYSTGAIVRERMRASRGFDKDAVLTDIPTSLPGGSTSMAEGLYRGWDELRTVSSGQQSGLRVIVLFTDGATNSVPGLWDTSGVAKAVRTSDFPENPPDPDNMTHNSPGVSGFYHTESGNVIGTERGNSFPWNSTSTISQFAWLPTRSFHAHHRSSGIPSQFDLKSDTLQVNRQPQSARRPLRQFSISQNKYPAQIYNINNAARNLLEIIADAARSDEDGAYPIRIYTIGMGELVRYDLGTLRETSESILKRIANDPTSPDHNPQQLDGQYYFAETAADVGPAFQALQAQIIRLTK